MNIRRAQEKDIPRLIELLEQVLQIHADIRPDIFIPGTTKYTNEELAEMIKDDTKPIQSRYMLRQMMTMYAWDMHSVR